MSLETYEAERTPVHFASLRGQACIAAAPWTGVHSASQQYNHGHFASYVSSGNTQGPQGPSTRSRRGRPARKMDELFCHGR